MNLHEIQTFLSIAQAGGVTRAAGRLHRSQPAVTRRMKLLEAQLGAPLIERVRGGVVLTEAGRAFLPHAEAVLAALRDGADAVRGIAEDESSGTVSLALVGTLAGTPVLAQLRAFGRSHPGVRLELRTANSQETSDLVRRGEATLGLRYFEDSSAALASRAVAQERMVIACSSEHPLAGKRMRDARALRGDRWVSFPAARLGNDSFALLLRRTIAAAGLDGMDVVPIDSMTAQKRMIEAGFGIGLLPESGILEELRLGTLATIDVPRLRAVVPVAVVHRREGYLGAAARALLALIGGTRVAPRGGKRRR
ncbi:MAG: LysR family transcriptional regulator [Alphaproteobacteria bacterium]|nr:LysR family transcriptional regulator [Alphaproteobacteria bacterium]